MLYVERITTLEQEIQLLVKAINSAKKEILIRSGELDSRVWSDPRVIDAIKKKAGYSKNHFTECLKLGDELARKKEYEGAIANFDEARKFLERIERETGTVKRLIKNTRRESLMKAFGYIHNNIGFCYLQTGKYFEAAMHLESAIDCSPENSFAYNNLAEVHERDGRKEWAIGLYKKALEIMPDHPTAKQSLERLLS